MSEIIVLTKKDFDLLRQELISEIKTLIEPKLNKTVWLRSADVREMLNISDSTLQTMRINGTIPGYKLDTTWFYKYDEIIKALEKGKTRNS